MWQKVKGKYHLLLSPAYRIDDIADGRFLQTACQNQVQVRKKNQVSYPLKDKCGICSGVSHLVNTSVDEAKRIYLKKETRLVVLYRALELTSSKTLKTAIAARIRKVAGVDESHSQKESSS